METCTVLQNENRLAAAEMPDWQRMEHLAQNRIINSDTYNRTMDYLRGPEGWREQETYILQMRRSPYGYLVAAGIEDAIDELTSRPITQTELDEAEAHFEKNNVPFFNKAMWQEIIDNNEGLLPIEISGVRDGTVMLPGEPMLQVTGPGELIAHFEHIFHRPYYDTLVATKAHEILRVVKDPQRFIEVGKRGTPDEVTHMRATKAMQIGGGFTLTSNDGAVAAFEDLQSVGTIGHRYVQRFPTVESAFRNAIERLDAVILLVDLVDSYDGMRTALELKEEFRDTEKKLWIRLDSGDIKEQVRFYLDECKKMGFDDTNRDKVVVEGIESLDELRDIEESLSEEEKPFVVYGAGGLLVAQDTTRADASTGFKLSEYEDPETGEMIACQKFSDSPGKESLPGKPTVVELVDGRRIIAQVGEYAFEAKDVLLRLLYANNHMFEKTPIKTAAEVRERGYTRLETMIENGERTEISPQTARLIGEIMCRYGLREEC